MASIRFAYDGDRQWMPQRMPASLHAARMCPDRLDHRRLVRVELRSVPHGERQVARADVDAGQSGGCGDRLHVRKRRCGLHHRQRDHGVVRPRDVVRAVGEQRACRSEAARAGRRVARVGHQPLGVGPGVDHRADDAERPGVEQLHDDAGLQPRHPRHRGRVARRQRLEHGERRLVVVQAVLEVDGDGVESGLAGHFGDDRVGGGEPTVDGAPAVVPGVAQLGLQGDAPRRVGGEPTKGAATYWGRGKSVKRGGAGRPESTEAAHRSTIVVGASALPPFLQSGYRESVESGECGAAGDIQAGGALHRCRAASWVEKCTENQRSRSPAN